MSLPAIHRVVTGHRADGRAIVIENGPLPRVEELSAIPGTVFHEVWCTTGSPAPVDNGPDPTTGPLGRLHATSSLQLQTASRVSWRMVSSTPSRLASKWPTQPTP